MNKISLIQLSETEVITKLLAVVVINDDEVCNVPVTIVNHMNGNCDFSFHTSQLPISEYERHEVANAIVNERFNQLEKGTF
jgi:hypothetical protein